MTAARLEIVSAGLRDLVQDAGRLHGRGVGAPVSGAADAPLWRLTQAVAGGPDGAAAIEFALRGPVVRAVDGPVRVALGGAAGRVTNAAGETAPLPPLRSVTLQPGERLVMGPTTRALGYLCVAGGIDAPAVLGARATDLRAGFGGWRGRALRAGDALPLGGDAPIGSERAAPRAPADRAGRPLRVIMGPQTAHFTDAALETFLAADWRVTDDVDRMGVRLEGPRLAHSDLGADMTSEGLTVGAVQVPGAGQPIVLGVESHTVGGYPKIAVVIAADIAELGQLRPGDRLRFEAVSLAEAQAARQAAARDLAGAIAAVAPWRGAATVDADALRGANLVSGVVHAGAPRFPHALEDEP